MNATATVSEHPAKPASTAIAKTDVTKVRDLLMKNADGLKVALPQHIPVSAFIRVALTVVQRTPALLECDRTSLLGAMFQAAQLGLSLDPSLGQAYLVPFKNTKKNRSEVQFIPGYRGLVDLVRRSGQLSTIDADVVRQKDTFRFVRGFSPLFEHIPSEDADPGAVTKVYAWARLKDGGVQMKVMTVADVEKIRKRSKAATAGPWVTDWDWMAKKTAIKQLCKLLPVSTETERAMHLDDRHESGRPQDLAMLADENETPTITDEDEVINTETGEVTMPRRMSEQPTPASEPTPKAAPIPAGADRVVDVVKKTGKRGVYWLAECESKRNVFTYDAGLGAALERFKASGDLCDLVADPAVANGWREIVSIDPLGAREPGSDG